MVWGLFTAAHACRAGRSDPKRRRFHQGGCSGTQGGLLGDTAPCTAAVSLAADADALVHQATCPRVLNVSLAQNQYIKNLSKGGAGQVNGRQ